MGSKKSAEHCSVCQYAADRAWQLYLKSGWQALRTRRSGRPLDSGHRRTDAQQKETRRLIGDKMPFAFWARKAVARFIREHYGVGSAARSMSEYMKRWGFTARKPMHRAFEQRPAEVLKWKEQTYPATARRAQR